MGQQDASCSLRPHLPLGVAPLSNAFLLHATFPPTEGNTLQDLRAPAPVPISTCRARPCWPCGEEQSPRPRQVDCGALWPGGVRGGLLGCSSRPEGCGVLRKSQRYGGITTPTSESEAQLGARERPETHTGPPALPATHGHSRGARRYAPSFSLPREPNADLYCLPNHCIRRHLVINMKYT